MVLKFHLPLYILLHHLSLRSRASVPGTLALFLDEECSQASIINPSVNVPTDTCLVTSGALGIAVEALPPCASGDATLMIYQDTSCANLVGGDLQYTNYYFNVPIGVSAVLFACEKVAEGAVATATSTTSAGSSSIPVAVDTSTTTSSSDISQKTTPSSNGATTTSVPSSSSTSSKSPQTNTNSASTGSGISWKGQIALGIGVPVSSLVVALLAWWFPREKKRRKQDPSQGHAPSMMRMSPSDASIRQPSGRIQGFHHQGSSMLWGQDHQGTLRERKWWF
ncbi:MAG: hypothetical protein Q9161_000759 [Pseudevernia consocians]